VPATVRRPEISNQTSTISLCVRCRKVTTRVVLSSEAWVSILGPSAPICSRRLVSRPKFLRGCALESVLHELNFSCSAIRGRISSLNTRSRTRSSVYPANLPFPTFPRIGPKRLHQRSMDQRHFAREIPVGGCARKLSAACWTLADDGVRPIASPAWRFSASGFCGCGPVPTFGKFICFGCLM